MLKWIKKLSKLLKDEDIKKLVLFLLEILVKSTETPIDDQALVLIKSLLEDDGKD